MSTKTRIAVLLVVVVGLWRWTSPHGFDPRSLKGKRVLVTGASSGIGEQLAYAYARLGARLVITARRGYLLETVALKCSDLGAQRVDVVAADLSVPEGRAAVVARASDILGALDHLILNHGVFPFGFWNGSPEDLTTIRAVLEVNFVSHIDLASRALPLLASGDGRIGVVSSVMGKMGQAGATAYSASKFALQGFFGAWRQDPQRLSFTSVTLCVLSLIDTDAAMRQMQRDFPSVDLSVAGSAVDAAEAIVRGVTNGDIEIYSPTFARLLVIVHSFFPEMLEDYVTMSATADLQQWSNKSLKIN